MTLDFGVLCFKFSLLWCVLHLLTYMCVLPLKGAIKGMKFPKLSSFAFWSRAMINPQWLELPIPRVNFRGPKEIRVIEVRPYLAFFFFFLLLAFWPLSCWAQIYPAFANIVDPDQLASEKPTDLDLQCLSFSMWIYINNLDQIIWLAENWKWAWHLNLFSMTRVKAVVLVLYVLGMVLCLITTPLTPTFI